MNRFHLGSVIHLEKGHSGNESPDKAHEHPFQQERPADEPVGGPHIFHDAHFPPTGKDRNADRIGNNEKGGNGKHDDEENASQAQDTCQLEEMFHHFLSKFSRFHSGHLFDLGHDFLDAFRFIHLDFKGIREGVVLSQGIKELFLFAEPFLEILQGFFLCHALDFHDAPRRLELLLYLTALHARCGIRHIDRHLDLIFQVLGKVIDIENHRQKEPQDKDGKGNRRHGRNTHKGVAF